MKTDHFGSSPRFNRPRLNGRPLRRLNRGAERPGLAAAALGVACVIGVFSLLTLLYHLG